MPTLIKQFTFVADTNIAPNQVNANFDDIVSFINNSLIHKDGSRAMDAHLSLVAANPTTDNQAARKAYVDSQMNAATGVANTAQTAANNAQGSANTALDRVPNKIRWGFVSGTTNGAGDIAFAHGLGGVPAAVVLTQNNSSPTMPWFLAVQNKDGANVNVRMYNSTNGNAMGGTGVSFFWFAGL